MLPMMHTLEASAVSSSDFTAVLTALQSQISVSTIVEVLAVLAGAAIGMVFMWWGVRKIAKTLMSAFKKGKLSV